MPTGGRSCTRDRDAGGLCCVHVPRRRPFGPTPPPLLHSAEPPTVPIRHDRGCSRVACHRWRRPRTLGGRRSEVKEEAGRSPAGGHERSRPPDGLGLRCKSQADPPNSGLERHQRPLRTVSRPPDPLRLNACSSGGLREDRRVRSESSFRQRLPSQPVADSARAMRPRATRVRGTVRPTSPNQPRTSSSSPTPCM